MIIKRLTNKTFKLDIERMRRGWYSDKYFENIGRMLTALAVEGYTYSGTNHKLPESMSHPRTSRWATSKSRCSGLHAAWGIRSSSAWINHWRCSGIAPAIGTAISSSTHPIKLEVWAVHDGTVVKSDGNPLHAEPVIKVRGRYRDFALLETPTLGVLTRSSRVATNVYETLMAARGKPVLFFPARFDMHEVQAADGYAYNIAIQRFNMDFSQQIGSFVSTDAQGDWWGGAGGGTVAHAAIASFMGDTAEAMMQFSRILPANIPRIALVDFNNDSVRDTLRVLEVMFRKYQELCDRGDQAEAAKYVLYGVRLDTSGTLRDVSVEPLGDPALDLGVNPRLVFNVRHGLDSASENWDLPPPGKRRRVDYCRNVKIVVSGGFNPDKIRKFEKLGVPVDIYAVGSWLFNNNGGTVTDFTGDVVRVKVHGRMDQYGEGREKAVG